MFTRKELYGLVWSTPMITIAKKYLILTDELKKWISWAQQKVNWYDPFINAKNEWLNDEDKNSIFIQVRSTANEFFNQPPNMPYFPRPWYSSRNR